MVFIILLEINISLEMPAEVRSLSFFNVNNTKILIGHICTMLCGYKTSSTFIITLGIQFLQQSHVLSGPSIIPYCKRKKYIWIYINIYMNA